MLTARVSSVPLRCRMRDGRTDSGYRYGHRSACGAAAAGGFHSRASNGARGEDLVVGMGMDDQNDRPAQVWFDRHDREADAHDVLPPFSGAQHRCVHVRHSMVTALTDAWH